MALEPWRVWIVVIAGVVLLWRLARGAHSWAQVATFWLASVAAILVVVGLDPPSRVVAVALAAVGWSLWYAFEVRRSTARPADHDIFKRRVAEWPATDPVREARIQAVLLLYTVLQAVAVPILFLSGHLGPVVIAAAFILTVVVLIGGAYLTFRSMPRPANPFERRGRGFLAWLWAVTSGMVLVPLRRLPWRTPRRRSQAEGRH